MKSGVALVKLLLAFVILLTATPKCAGKIKNDKLQNGKSPHNSNDIGKLQRRVSKNLRRVRKDVVNGDLTEQTIQCEIPSLSCQNCCENSINCTHKAKFCRCDPQCTFYNDCCVDYETFCRREENFTSLVDPQGLSCTNVMHVKMESDSDMVWIINKCPRNRKTDEISYNCENADKLELNVSNIQHLVPVVSKNLIFRNEFCAKCNDIEQFDTFSFDMRCYRNLSTRNSIGSFAELIKFAFKYCETSKYISIFREYNQPFRQCNQYFRHLCPTSKELNEKCNRSRNNDCISATHWCNLNLSKWDEKADEKCREVYSAKVTPQSHAGYNLSSNITTRTANVKKPTPYVLTTPKIGIPRPYVTLRAQVSKNFHYAPFWFYSTGTKFQIKVLQTSDLYEVETPKAQIEVRQEADVQEDRSLVASITKVLRQPVREESIAIQRCPYGKFYDEFLDICRDGVSIPLMKEKLDKFSVAIWLDLNGIPPSRDDIGFSFAQLFNFEIYQVNDLRIDNSSATWARSSWIIHFKLSLTNEQTLLLAKDNYTTTNNSVSEVENDQRHFTRGLPLQRLLFFSGTFNITISNRTYTVVRTTSRQLACIRKRSFLAGTYTSMQNGSYYYINATGQSFARKRVFFEGANMSVCDQIVFSTCVGQRLVTLTSDEYVKFDNLSIFYNRTNTIYDFGEYDVKDGHILMCIPEGSSKYFVSDPRNSLVIQGYLTLICFVLSLTCLFVVIQTYLIFPELRNLPGKNLLSLSVSLFFTQFLWLIPDQWYSYTLCHVIAATKHYLFFVSFVAMATIAWDTHLRFACKDVRNISPKNREVLKKFYKYSAIVWGFPAMFVVACVVIDREDVYAVYVNDRMCWFDNTHAQQYLFVLPVALLIVFNVIFFALTVFRIQRVRASTILVRSDQNRRKMFWIYFKLSALMGFSWLFGFIDLFVRSTQVFSYLFTIFASLQGVYIALAFVMKKEVWKKYKKLFEKKSEENLSSCAKETKV